MNSYLHKVEDKQKKILVQLSSPVVYIIGTLRSKDGDGRENVEKVNSRSFNLYRDYSKSLT